jgi:hypothetical protein
MENTYIENMTRVQPSKSTLRNPRSINPKAVLEMEVWRRVEGEDLWLGPKGVMVNSAALEERKFFFNIVQVS